jgi:hypothetical protein
VPSRAVSIDARPVAGSDCNFASDVILRDLLVCVDGLTGDARSAELTRTETHRGSSGSIYDRTIAEIEITALETEPSPLAVPEATLAVIPIVIAEAPPLPSIPSFSSPFIASDRSVSLILHATERRLRLLWPPPSPFAGAAAVEWTPPTGTRIVAVSGSAPCAGNATSLPLVAVGVSQIVYSEGGDESGQEAPLSTVHLLGVGFVDAMDPSSTAIVELSKKTLFFCDAGESRLGADEEDYLSHDETPSISQLCLFDSSMNAPGYGCPPYTYDAKSDQCIGLAKDAGPGPESSCVNDPKFAPTSSGASLPLNRSNIAPATRHAFVTMSFWNNAHIPAVRIVCADGLPLSGVEARSMSPQSWNLRDVLQCSLPVSNKAPVEEAKKRVSSTEASSQIVSLAMVDLRRDFDNAESVQMPSLLAGLADGRVLVSSILTALPQKHSEFRKGELRLGEVFEFRVGRLPVQRLVPFATSWGAPDVHRRPRFAVLANCDSDAVVHCQCGHEVAISRIVPSSHGNPAEETEGRGTRVPIYDTNFTSSPRRCICVLNGNGTERTDHPLAVNLAWLDDAGRLGVGTLNLSNNPAALDNDMSNSGSKAAGCYWSRRLVECSVTQMLYLPHIDALLVSCRAPTPSSVREGCNVWYQGELRIYDSSVENAIRELWRKPIAPGSEVNALSLAPSPTIESYAGLIDISSHTTFGGVVPNTYCVAPGDSDSECVLSVEVPSGACWQTVAVATHRADNAFLDHSTDALLVPPTGAIVVLEIRRQFAVANERASVSIDRERAAGGGDIDGSDLEAEQTVVVRSLGATMIPAACSALAMGTPAIEDAIGVPNKDRCSRPDGALVATFDDTVCLLQWELQGKEKEIDGIRSEDAKDTLDTNYVNVPTLIVVASASAPQHGCLTALSTYREWISVAEIFQAVLVFRSSIVSDGSATLNLVAKFVDPLLAVRSITLLPIAPSVNANSIPSVSSDSQDDDDDSREIIGVLVADLTTRRVLLLRWRRRSVKLNTPEGDQSIGSDFEDSDVLLPMVLPPLSGEQAERIPSQVAPEASASSVTEQQGASSIKQKLLLERQKEKVVALLPSLEFHSTEAVTVMERATFSSSSTSAYCPLGVLLGGTGGGVMAVQQSFVSESR